MQHKPRLRIRRPPTICLATFLLQARRISYEQFSKALEALAEVRGSSTLEVKRAVAASDGPQRRGTTPQPLRFSSSGARTSAGERAREGAQKLALKTACFLSLQMVISIQYVRLGGSHVLMQPSHKLNCIKPNRREGWGS